MDADAYELCCFVTHEGTSTEAAIWRDKERKRAVLAFRNTSDIKARDHRRWPAAAPL